jgi:hydroxymethylglutaryl-CoA reductase
VEAGAHAFAAGNGAYTALTNWTVGEDDALHGALRIPIKVGIVGGTVHSNPAAELGLSIVDAQSATELAELMAAVGLAQNFSALRALATQGIQQGHMRLHARGLVAATGVANDRADEIVEELVASGDVKASRARELVAAMAETEASLDASAASASGKVILFGEHAVVYGRHALALPLEHAVRAIATETETRTRLRIPNWSFDAIINTSAAVGPDAAVNRILQELDVVEKCFSIRATSLLPRGMGLGSSAAFAVAVTRAVAACCDIDIDDERVNDIAFECEKLAHGTPSGIDNTVACYGEPLLFRRTNPLTSGGVKLETLLLTEAPPLVVAFSDQAGLTGDQVAGVRTRFEKSPAQYNALFDQIDSLSCQGKEAMLAKDYAHLGRMMNVCQGLLNALEVSTPDLEHMIALARKSGATGAKLTGSGGGGAVVALCPGKEMEVRAALIAAGYSVLQLAETNGAQH